MATKEYLRGLTPRILILIPFFVIANLIQSTVTESLTLWWAYRSWFPLPFIFFVAILYGLFKVSPKFRLTPQEYTILFVISFIVSNTFVYGMYFSGAYGLSFITHYGQSPLIWIANDPTYRSAFIDWIPPWWVAKEAAALQAAWTGGPIEWRAWLPSVIYWSIFFFLLTTFQLCWGFFLRKPLIEVERLPFPGILPSAYLLTYSTQPSVEKPMIFNRNLIQTKIFWIAFTLGFLITFLDFIRYFIPEVPASTIIGVHTLDLTPYTRTFLPGAHFYSTVRMTDIALYFLCSVDFLLTLTICWFVFAVLYPVIGINAGFLPYSVGVEGNPAYYGANVGPFKYMYFSAWGVSLGMALWLIINNRKHFANIFRNAFSKTEVDSEDGMSYRMLSRLTIIVSLAFLIFCILSGMPVFVAIVFLVLYTLMLFSWTRMMGDVHEFMPPGLTYNWLYYDAGALIGAWPSPPPAQNAAAFITLTITSVADQPAARINNVSMHHQFKTYKVGHMMKTSAKDIFIATLLCLLFASIFSYAFTIWWYHIKGGLYARAIYPGANTGVASAVYGFVAVSSPSPPIVNPLERYGLLISGIIVTFICYVLRLRYAWFFINPSALLMLPLITWWAAGIIGLVLKVLVLRFGGAKIYEEYAIPFVTGFLVGYGVNAALVAFCATIFIAIPKLF
ncbi:MAG: DUF6785 family protein [Candidatus Bathyarchaeia archaeon]